VLVIFAIAKGRMGTGSERDPGGTSRVSESRQSAPPPSPTPPQAQESVAPAALEASAKLFRVGAQGDERLLSGARIGPGDHLQMEFQSPERVYLYVLDQDQAGHAFVLFPAPGLDGGNPLAGGAQHRLPGTQGGKTATWEVSSPGGKEQVLAIAARAPLKELEREIARFPRASASQPVVYGRVSDSTLLAVRGIGRIGVVDGAPASAGKPGFARALRQIPGSGSSTGGVWTWTIEMENPAR
jgi:hypothetical protein